MGRNDLSTDDRTPNLFHQILLKGSIKPWGVFDKDYSKDIPITSRRHERGLFTISEKYCVYKQYTGYRQHNEPEKWNYSLQ